MVLRFSIRLISCVIGVGSGSFQGDSQSLPLDDHSVDMIVTDPPYYDSVQYSNLAAFFRVWLTRLLPDEAEWSYDESDSAVATKATTGVSNFMRVIAGIFAECGRVLKKTDRADGIYLSPLGSQRVG